MKCRKSIQCDTTAKTCVIVKRCCSTTTRPARVRHWSPGVSWRWQWPILPHFPYSESLTSEAERVKFVLRGVRKYTGSLRSKGFLLWRSGFFIFKKEKICPSWQIHCTCWVYIWCLQTLVHHKEPLRMIDHAQGKGVCKSIIQIPVFIHSLVMHHIRKVLFLLLV